MIKVTKAGVILRFLLFTCLGYIGAALKSLPAHFTVPDFFSLPVILAGLVGAALVALAFVNTAWAAFNHVPAPAGPTPNQLAAQNEAVIQAAVLTRLPAQAAPNVAEMITLVADALHKTQEMTKQTLLDGHAALAASPPDIQAAVQVQAAVQEAPPEPLPAIVAAPLAVAAGVTQE